MALESYTPNEMRRHLERLDEEPRRTWQRQYDFTHLDLSASAVLVPLSEHNGELYVLFTQRSLGLRNHSGEVSFPGGRREPQDDSLVATALRESHEEISLNPGDVHVYGALARIPVISGFQVTAFVGEYGHDDELISNPSEIDQIFRAPLSALADPTKHRLEIREFQGHAYPIHFFDYDGHVIWGATGFLLHSLLEYLELVG